MVSSLGNRFPDPATRTYNEGKTHRPHADRTILLAPLLLQGCSPSLPDHEAGTPSSLEMEFHRLKVEPLVHSTYPTYRRYHDSLAPQVVVITVDGMERIGWEDRPAKASWIVRLPEQIYVNGKKLHYQVGMEWKLEGTRWSYADSPVKDCLLHLDSPSSAFASVGNIASSAGSFS